MSSSTRPNAIVGSEATRDAQSSTAKDASNVQLLPVSSSNASASGAPHARGFDADQLSSRLMVTKVVGDKLNGAKKLLKTYGKFVGPGFMIAVAYSKYYLCWMTRDQSTRN